MVRRGELRAWRRRHRARTGCGELRNVRKALPTRNLSANRARQIVSAIPMRTGHSNVQIVNRNWTPVAPRRRSAWSPLRCRPARNPCRVPSFPCSCFNHSIFRQRVASINKVESEPFSFNESQEKMSGERARPAGQGARPVCAPHTRENKRKRLLIHGGMEGFCF
jgi:hypothetical protein